MHHSIAQSETYTMNVYVHTIWCTAVERNWFVNEGWTYIYSGRKWDSSWWRNGIFKN